MARESGSRHALPARLRDQAVYGNPADARVEQGRLSLDDPISTFFPGAPESWSGVHVRQLANHTSGLNEDLGQPRPKTLAGAVAASMKQPLAYEPGTEARYGSPTS